MRGTASAFLYIGYLPRMEEGLNRQLGRRGIVGWVSGVDLWKRQQRSRGDFDLASALTLLASLELNLRADRRRASPLFQA